jgi:hypothetical protein
MTARFVSRLRPNATPPADFGGMWGINENYLNYCAGIESNASDDCPRRR